MKNPISVHAGDNVEMHVIHQLTSRQAIVAKHVVSVTSSSGNYGLGDPTDPLSQVRQDLRGALIKGGIMRLGDHQGMSYTDRPDIKKGKHGRVLIN